MNSETILKVATGGLAGLVGGSVVGLVAISAVGATTPDATEPLMAWWLGGGLLIGLTMATKHRPNW